jgi:hypothetical protein
VLRPNQLAGERQKYHWRDSDDCEYVREDSLTPREPEVRGPTSEQKKPDCHHAGGGSRRDARKKDECSHVAEAVEPRGAR